MLPDGFGSETASWGVSRNEEMAAFLMGSYSLCLRFAVFYNEHHAEFRLLVDRLDCYYNSFAPRFRQPATKR